MASDPLLPVDELVRSAEEDLRWQVPAQFATQWALDGDRLEGELLPARGHIAAAPFAGDHEVPTLDAGEAECHSMSIGEVKAKVLHSPKLENTPTNVLSRLFRHLGDSQVVGASLGQ